MAARDPRPRLWFAGGSLALYGLFVTLILFWPSPVDRGWRPTLLRALDAFHERGFPEWFGYQSLEFTANIGMFVPLGFLVALLVRGRRWWLAVALCSGFSVLSELAQGLLLPQRFASVADVVANSTGAALGALLALAIRKLVPPRVP